MSEEETNWQYVAERYESLYNCNHKEHMHLTKKYKELQKQVESAREVFKMIRRKIHYNEVVEWLKDNK